MYIARYAETIRLGDWFWIISEQDRVPVTIRKGSGVEEYLQRGAAGMLESRPRDA